MADHTKSINSVLWPDAEIDNLSIDYDTVSISLKESTGRKRIITCEGYIGYKVVGFWDESIVASGNVEYNHPFITECLGVVRAKYGDKAWPTGSPARNQNNWSLLRIELIDGIEILIVCSVMYVRDIT